MRAVKVGGKRLERWRINHEKVFNFYFDNLGESYGSGRVAKKLKMRPSTALKHIKSLEDEKLLIKAKKRGRGWSYKLISRFETIEVKDFERHIKKLLFPFHGERRSAIYRVGDSERSAITVFALSGGGVINLPHLYELIDLTRRNFARGVLLEQCGGEQDLERVAKRIAPQGYFMVAFLVNRGALMRFLRGKSREELIKYAFEEVSFRLPRYLRMPSLSDSILTLAEEHGVTPDTVEAVVERLMGDARFKALEERWRTKLGLQDVVGMIEERLQWAAGFST